MENNQTIAQCQQFLQALAPVEGWLYIGAGRGEVLRETRFAKVPRLLAVEAEQHASQLLAHAIAAHNNENSNWKALHALVNNVDGQATWHQLSREEESGLLPANTLSALWPNLAEQQRAEHTAVPLSHLLEQTGDNPAQYNWLTIDCLPAARLLQGLNGTLQSLDMIEVRVAVGGIAPGETGSTLKECDELLLPQGFTRLATEQANNPLVGRALYGRNFKLQLAEALKVYTKLENQYHTLASQCDELNAKNDAIHKDREDLRNQLENQKKRVLQLQEKLQQTQIDLKEQQRSAQLSTKLLAKVEADTSELRERYAEKVKSEQELKDLIKELHAKLQAASHFYHKLEQEHPELLEKL